MTTTTDTPPAAEPAKPNAKRGLLTVADLAELLQAHPRTIRRWAATERIVRHLADVWPDDEEWAFASAIHEIRRATRAQ